MQPGNIVADRFVVERLAGRGGMGSVYRAFDRIAGEPVALKVVEAGSPLFEERFFREARALASISHPAVVRYVAQGAMPHFLWLAMEWLEGEDLSDRLARERFDLADGIDLLARVSDAVAAAHEAGIIHRDLKPSNLFLTGGDPRAVKVLDFGVARTPERARPLTKTGQMVGTVGFMSPEQISGDRDLDHRADIFAIGCVAFEVLTGRPAFPGATLIAIIAKVLKDDPPHPSEIDPRIPAALDALVLSMLAKPRSERPSSAAAIAEQLRTIGKAIARRENVAVPNPRSSVTGREQRLVSVILAAPQDPGTNAEFAVSARRLGEAWQADVLELGDGAHLFVVGGAGSAKDQAARAASCAIQLRLALPDAHITVGTGLAEPTGGLPVGPAIDRAAQLFETRSNAGIAIDDVTAALLDDQFEVVVSNGVHALAGKARTNASTPPPARGTPFVGRDKEMAMIDAVIAESFSEPVARAVLVTGMPGAGKSRLRREFLARALTRETEFDLAPRAVFARADVVGSGSALSLARQIAERLLGIQEGEPRESKASKLARWVAAMPTAEEFDAGHAREFLGELVGTPTEDPPTMELQSARNEPRGLAEWLRRAFALLVREEAWRGPLVLVLEDLHWGDEASVDFVAEAMQAATNAPLFVLALARPEVWEVLPRLRESLAPQEVRLAGLTPKASQKLAEAALGKGASPEVVARIVARADGNPFFLEELARSATDGHTDTSETVLAVVQARIQRLDPEARRLLRAASVFGRVFQREGVARLLGIPASTPQIDELIAYLDERELVERARGQDVRHDAGYAFRHDLVRDAAYATLPEGDRGRAHLLAAEWLETQREEDAAILAEHFERAGERERAVDYLARAIEQAQNAASYDRVVALTKRAVDAGASGEVRGTMRAAEGLARAWQHDWRGAHAATTEALALLPRGSTPWFRAASVHTFASVSIGDPSSMAGLTKSVVELAKAAEPTGAYGFAVFALTLALGLVGQRAPAKALLADLDARDDAPLTDFGFVGWSALARGMSSLLLDGDPGPALRHVDVAARFAPGLHDSVFRVVLEYFRSTLLYDCGDFESSLKHAQAVLDAKGANAIPYLRSWATHAIGRVQLYTGQLDQALTTATALVTSEDVIFAQRARSLVAQVLFAQGKLDAALAEARQVVGSHTFAPQDAAAALAVEARVHIARGAFAEAVALSARALDIAEKLGCSPTTDAAIRGAHIEALTAAGDHAGARRVAETAAARIDTVARGLRVPRYEATFRAFPENAKIFAFLASTQPAG